jgi:hypothetical protein
MPAQFDKEKAKQNVTRVLEKMQTEADPHVLSEYRALFKHISLFRRSWVSAYLLMLFDQGALGRAEGNRFRKAESAVTGSSNDGPRFPLTEEESKRLFISIGRNRRVFPREILGLINAKTAISKDDIGSIRILDNYSFVQVRNTAAETIIAALNGCTFRGRTLAVNYAKSRKDQSSSGAENEAFESLRDDSHDTGVLEQDEDHPDKENI